MAAEPSKSGGPGGLTEIVPAAVSVFLRCSVKFGLSETGRGRLPVARVHTISPAAERLSMLQGGRRLP
jgi:hypothetical protein